MNGTIPLTLEWAFGILMSFVIALLWHFIRQLENKFAEAQKDRGHLRQSMHDIEVRYATKAEAQANQKNVMDALGRLENKMDKLSDKLDRKADKS